MNHRRYRKSTTRTPAATPTLTTAEYRALAKVSFAQRGRESLVRLAAGATHGGTPELHARIADRMLETGECVWHAAAQVSGTACWCQDCRPDIRRFC